MVHEKKKKNLQSWNGNECKCNSSTVLVSYRAFQFICIFYIYLFISSITCFCYISHFAI